MGRQVGRLYIGRLVPQLRTLCVAHIIELIRDIVGFTIAEYII